MEKKVIHRLPIHFAHATSINHNDTLLSEIVQGKDLPLRCRPSFSKITSISYRENIISDTLQDLNKYIKNYLYHKIFPLQYRNLRIFVDAFFSLLALIGK
jgi:hypothetical protein